MIRRGLVLLALGATSAFAQERELPTPKPREIVTPGDRATLRQRERGTLHPGVPLDVSGIEEGDNDFRARTPILMNSDRAPTYVDVEENRRRRLAMYTEGARFDSAPAPALASFGSGAPRTTVRETPRVQRDPDTSGSESSSFGAWFLATVIAVVGGGIVFQSLFRKSGS